jgi:hypothetical protein
VKLMKLSVLLMALLTALLLAGSLAGGIDPDFRFYTSPVFLAAVGAFTAVQLACLIKHRLSLRSIGFYLCHAGLVVVILGAFAGYLFAEEVNFNIPIASGAAYGVVARTDGSEVAFGFDIAVADFAVEKYDADYRVFSPDPAAENGYALYRDRVTPDRGGSYDLGPAHGRISREDLMDEAGFREQVTTPDGLLMVRLSQADKYYAARLQVFDGGEARDATLAVNHPHVYKGWKFYLMDYDREQGSFVSMYAKKDPGNGPIRLGLWMILAGTALMCFRVFDRKGAAKNGTP